MIAAPPPGSRLSVRSVDGKQTIIARPAPAGLASYGYAAFLTLWLGGWGFGWIAAAKSLVEGSGGLFLLFWLGAWTLGGGVAAYYLYRLLRPVVPESLTLSASGVDYDSGVPRLPASFFTRRRYPWGDFTRMLFRKRLRRRFAPQDLSKLRLRETADGNRLTIDLGAERLDLAREANALDREWLYRTLTERYEFRDPPATV